MPRKNVSATVSEDVYEFLDQSKNKSETIDEAVRQYMMAGGNERAMIELRLEQEKSRRQSLKNELQSVESDIEQLQDRLKEIVESKHQHKQQTIEQIAQKVKPTRWMNSGNKESQLPSCGHQIYQNNADDMDMTPKELREAVVDYILTEESNE